MSEALIQLRRSSDEIVALHRPLRVLRLVHWGPRVHQRFLAARGRELPRVEYPPLGFDPRELGRRIAEVRRRLPGRNPVEELLRRKCDELATMARMLEARGTPRFYAQSVRLYGGPRRRVEGLEAEGLLALARIWASRRAGPVERATLSSAQAVEVVRGIVAPHLGAACRVRESSRLTANAAAGTRTVSLRRGASFSLCQARALAHHEGLWHVLTALNGARQPVLSILGIGLARSTESQEGGGLLSELLTGSLSEERLAEIGARTLAVDLAARGASFLEVFRLLRERFELAKAIQLAERVFRGGVVSGGSPFTKDAVYQRGFLRAFGFVRSAVERGNVRLLSAFVAGKMAIEDAPLVAHLIEEGICVGPAFVPQWLIDERALAERVARAQVAFPFFARPTRDSGAQIAAPARRRARAAVCANAALALDEDEDGS